MDPLTQGALGALVAQGRSRPRDLGRAALIGALAGMAPDLDVLIRSASDPLLALEYHRHFTHSLFFIPFGALLCSLVFHPLQRRAWGMGWLQIYTWCLLGYGSHGLLDACTSYGTQLLWPFSNQRFAWDIISVIDPLFSLPLLGLVLWAGRSSRRRPITWAAAWCSAYLVLGVVQHERALQSGRELAAERGHDALRLEAKPSFANLAVWKVIYATDSHFYVSAVKPGLLRPTTWPGDSTPRLNPARDLPWLQPGSAQARDLDRFEWFSAGYIALDREDPTLVVDIRYSLLPDEIEPLWGIRFAPDAPIQQPVEYYSARSGGGGELRRLLGMIFY